MHDLKKRLYHNSCPCIDGQYRREVSKPQFSSLSLVEVVNLSEGRSKAAEGAGTGILISNGLGGSAGVERPD